MPVVEFRVVTEDGKVRPLTIVERRFWAHITAYTVQIIDSVRKEIDERQLEEDLGKLEAMVNQATTSGKENKTALGTKTSEQESTD